MKKAEYNFVVRSIVEELVSFLMEDYKMPMLEAFDKIYNSHIFEKLQDKSTGLYLRSAAYVYEYLKKESPYAKEDVVKGVIYEISKNFGAFVAVDNLYSALIPAKEFHGEYEIGDEVEARVTAVKPDGKLDLSIRRKAHLQMDADAAYVMQVIDEFDGVLPFNDKASPEVIKREMQMSKNEFKKAVGHLLKTGKIEITEKSIRLK